MSSRADHPPSPFTASERDLIRREMGMHFGQYPSLAEGLFLRTWRGGPQVGEPKIPLAWSSSGRGGWGPGPCSRRRGWQRCGS
jgi:hypothetical protein